MSLYYSTDKFKNIFLIQKSSRSGIVLRDRSTLEIKESNTKYDRFLEIECQYTFKNYWLLVRLKSKKYNLDSLVNKEIVDFLDFNLLLSDLSGM